MSTPFAPPRPAPQRRPRTELSHPDPAERVALVARARRPGVLRAHRRLLRPEDLEDCFSQAVLELLAAARRGQRFSTPTHIAHTLEQRFLSRVHDRLRAVRGRSPMQAALEGALPLNGSSERGLQLADPRAELHPLVARRLELQRVREVAPRLTPDQRLILATQVFLQIDRAEFCARYGWSYEKYRKVAQRARRRLRSLVDEPPSEFGLRIPELPVPPLPAGRNKETGTHL
jgi:DNA-directed RNA polymerase specialized sigma24 family protein